MLLVLAGTRLLPAGAHADNGVPCPMWEKGKGRVAGSQGQSVRVLWYTAVEVPTRETHPFLSLLLLLLHPPPPVSSFSLSHFVQLDHLADPSPHLLQLSPSSSSLLFYAFTNHSFLVLSTSIHSLFNQAFEFSRDLLFSVPSLNHSYRRRQIGLLINILHIESDHLFAEQRSP